MTKNYILLFFLFSSFIVCRAQTETHDLDWFTNIGSNVDLTIEEGDKVIWTWRDALPHTVENNAGSQETFDSLTKTGLGETFEYTFTQIGTNPYLCGIHGANSMSGTITVVAEGTLNNKDYSLKSFNISPNPAKSFFKLELPNQINKVNLQVYDVLGKEILNKYLSSESIVDISGWNNGIYLVKVSSDNISHVKRFIKQ